MATTIITKNGSGAPTADDLSVGELAVDLTNKRLYSKNSSSEVIELGVNTASSLDVTGTVTADGLTVEGAVTSNTVDGALLNWDGADASLQASRTAGNYSSVSIKTTDGTMRTRLSVDYQGNISFYEDTGTTAKLVWKASDERLGIGTTSPAEKLHVAGAIATTAGISGHGANRATFSQEGANGAFIQSYGADTSTMGAFTFRQASSDFSVNAIPLTISATGNVGIGVTDPDQALEVNGVIKTSLGSGGLSMSGYGAPDLGYFAYNYFNNNGTETVGQSARSSHRITMGNGSTNAITFDYRAPSAAAGTWAERMRITSAGQTQVVGYDAMTLGFPAVAGGASRSGIKPTVTGAGDGQLQFLVGGNNVTEATTVGAMIDASGNLLVGTTDTTAGIGGSTEQGFALNAGLNAFFASRSGGAVQTLNRQGSGGTENGTISEFRSNGTTVGNIIATNGDLAIGTGSTTLRFEDASNAIYPGGADGSGTNAGTDLGATNRNFGDLYLSGGVYVGGSGAANYLDDYEEGSWTPTLAVNGFSASATVSSSTGVYTKIGNIVYVNCEFVMSGQTYPSSYCQITGTPFAASLTKVSVGSYDGVNPSSGTQGGSVSSGAAGIFVQPMATTTTSTTWRVTVIHTLA